jgi:hypothetical protein
VVRYSFRIAASSFSYLASTFTLGVRTPDLRRVERVAQRGPTNSGPTVYAKPQGPNDYPAAQMTQEALS